VPAALLRLLAGHEENKVRIVAGNGMGLGLTAMRKHPMHPDVQEECLRFLRGCFTQSEENKSTFVHLEGIAPRQRERKVAFFTGFSALRPWFTSFRFFDIF
jgi:hypothetical protein